MIQTSLFLFPQTSILLVKKLCCMCLKTTKQMIKMIKGKKPDNETCFQNPQSCSWLVVLESIWTPRSKSNTSTPETNSQTYRPREIPLVMNGTIFCVCSTSAISVLPLVLKWCRKEHKKMQVKKESQQSRSRWWIWSRNAAWGIRTWLPPRHQKAWGKPDMKVEYLRVRRTAVQQPRTERPVMGASSSEYPEWNIDEKVVFSRVDIWWNVGSKKRETRGWAASRSVHPAHRHFCHWWRFMDSRSFLHRVQKIYGPIFKRCNARQQQTLFNMVNVYVFSTLEASAFTGKNHSEHSHSIKNTVNNLFLKQMFDKSEKLTVGQSDEIYGVTPINWEDSSWKQLSLVSDGEVIQSLACKGLRIFRFCVMFWKDESEPNLKFCLGRKIELVQEFTTIQNFGRNWWRADGIRVEYFPGFTTLQCCNKVHEFMTKNERSIIVQRVELSSCRCSMTSCGIWRQWTGMCNADATLVSIFAKRFPAGRWSFLRPRSEKKWCSIYTDRPQGE